jgi:hypothetical protein
MSPELAQEDTGKLAEFKAEIRSFKGLASESRRVSNSLKET